MKSRFLIALLAALLTLAGCSEIKRLSSNTIFVTIAPLKPIIEGIVGEEYEVEILVPQGASPETFEPTPRQLRALESARLVFSTGLLDFERTLVERITREGQVVALSKGIDLIGGSCSHAHHAHGVDPHIWTSPKALLIMAENAYNAVVAANSEEEPYSKNYSQLVAQLVKLDADVAKMCKLSRKRSFIIYHPALSYLARDYGLEQISIEYEGKEPSVRRLKGIIDTIVKSDINAIFYQTEFPATSVEVLCQDADVRAIEINPLSEDVFTNIRNITSLITE